jgi:hypothetical protein
MKSRADESRSVHSPASRASGTQPPGARTAVGSSVVQHANLPEDPDVGTLRRQGGVWDWDEHRATYELAAHRAMRLVENLDALPGVDGAIARGLFAVATSTDEDHFSIRAIGGEPGVYKWPTVPSAADSKDVVLIGAFLGAARRDANLLEPQDIPLAVQRALVIRRNVPVLMLMVTESGLAAQRFALRADFFQRLLTHGAPVDASERDIQLSRRITILSPPQLPGRFKEVFVTAGFRSRHSPVTTAVRRVIDLLNGAAVPKRRAH